MQSTSQSVHTGTLLKLAQLGWTSHVTKMPDEQLPKKVFYGELQVGKRSQSGQKKRYKDTLKAKLQRISIFQLSPGNRLHRIEQSSVVSSGKEQISKCEAERRRKERKTKSQEIVIRR